MADLKMPEINYVIVAGNLTKDPIFRETTNKTPVVNFSVASNRRYKDSSNQWQEDVCYIGIVAWNRLAESCKDRLKKGSAVLIDGEATIKKVYKTNENIILQSENSNYPPIFLTNEKDIKIIGRLERVILTF